MCGVKVLHHSFLIPLCNSYSFDYVYTSYNQDIQGEFIILRHRNISRNAHGTKKTFYFREDKAILQKLTPRPGIRRGSNFEISNGDVYFSLQILILHKKKT